MQRAAEGESGAAAELSDSEKEFLRWKKTAPALYPTLLTHTLGWTSNACELLAAEEGADGRRRRLVVSGQSEVGENLLLFGELWLPRAGPLPPGNCLRFEPGVPHKGAVNALRAHGELLASFSADGCVYLFEATGVQRAALTGHAAEGFGLDWQPDGRGLASCALDGRMLVWDLVAPDRPRATHLCPRPLSAVGFHRSSANLLAAAGQNCALAFFDLRRPPLPFLELAAHTREVACLDFSPNCEFALLTGGGDGLAKLWDLRCLAEELQAFDAHDDPLSRVAWSPQHDGVFASAGGDGGVCLWDCAAPAGERGPRPFFRHGGHRGAVLDARWDALAEFGLLSVDDENSLQFWEAAPALYYGF